MTIRWAYGVQAVESRRKTYLPKTLTSLKKSGFDSPRLFIDACKDAIEYEREFQLEATCRGMPPLRTHGNWIISLYELYIRTPNAERYAIFQDDFVASLNLKAYLEKCTLEPKTYWNLYTFPSNQSICPKGEDNRDVVGWYKSNQFGRGAVGLVFDLKGTQTLLSSSEMVSRPQDPYRGWQAVDGGIIHALTKEGYTEMVHNPSLVQHIGDISSIMHHHQPKAMSFKGENFDLLTLLK